MGASDSFLSALLGGAVDQATKTLTGDPALDAFAVTAAKNNLYNKIAAPVLGTKFDTKTWSPGTAFAVNLGQALLGGALGKLGQADIEEQQTAMTNALPELYKSPSTFVIPEGVDVEAARQLQQSVIRENTQREKKLQDAVLADIFTRQPNYAALAPESASKVGLGELEEALKVQAQLAPSTANEFEELKAKYGDETLARQIFKDKQDLALKEKQSQADLQSSLKFVDEKFDRAKELTGWTTPFSLSKKDELNAIGDAAVMQADKIMGREMNDDVRDRVLGMSPKFYDTDPAVIERKKQNLKEFLTSLAKAPVGERAAVAAGVSPSNDSTKPEGETKKSTKVGRIVTLPDGRKVKVVAD